MMLIISDNYFYDVLSSPPCRKEVGIIVFRLATAHHGKSEQGGREMNEVKVGGTFRAGRMAHGLGISRIFPQSQRQSSRSLPVYSV